MSKVVHNAYLWQKTEFSLFKFPIFGCCPGPASRKETTVNWKIQKRKNVEKRWCIAPGVLQNRMECAERNLLPFREKVQRVQLFQAFLPHRHWAELFFSLFGNGGRLSTLKWNESIHGNPVQSPPALKAVYRRSFFSVGSEEGKKNSHLRLIQIVGMRVQNSVCGKFHDQHPGPRLLCFPHWIGIQTALMQNQCRRLQCFLCCLILLACKLTLAGDVNYVCSCVQSPVDTSHGKWLEQIPALVSWKCNRPFSNWCWA